MKKLLMTTALAALMLGRAHAGPARDAIQAAYNRCDEAYQYKFLDGILSIRTDDYQVLTQSGQRLPPRQEIATLQRILRAATKITAKDDIVECVEGTNQTRVRVSGHTVLWFPASNTKKPRTPMTIDTLEDDVWVKKGDQWKVQSSVVTKQDVVKGDNMQM
jgi:ketosteroid isomerase-like protein